MNLWQTPRHRTSVPVSSFYNTGKEKLQIELVAGECGLNRAIAEAAINRPGLALSGFYKYFAHKRIQLLGLAEQAYLSSLSAEERLSRLQAFFKKRMPCLVIARKKRVFPEIKELAEEHRIPVLRSAMITKHFINAATIIMENLTAPQMKVQGTMVEIMGIGVLITGKSGLGKSDTALGLIKQGHALVSDDITHLRLDSAGCVIGAPVNVTRYHMEIRGIGIVHVPSLFGVASVRGEKRLDLIATLQAPSDKSGNMLRERRTTREVFGVQVPEVVITVTPGRDLANVIETAALDQKLRRLGHDAEKELDQRLMDVLSGGRDASE